MLLCKYTVQNDRSIVGSFLETVGQFVLILKHNSLNDFFFFVKNQQLEQQFPKPYI